ncbi:hypothetical protein ACTFIW_012100 [Dictyostelium discoideum]
MEISLFPSYDYVLTTDASESGAGATLKKGNKTIKNWSFQWSITQSNMSSNRREMLALLMAFKSQEESELDWRAYSRILQCKSRPPQPSFRDESQIIVQRSVQSNPTSVRSDPDGSVRWIQRVQSTEIAESCITGAINLKISNVVEFGLVLNDVESVVTRSMWNQLLLLKNQTDIVNDPFITRIMTGIHKLRPSSAKYQEIWDANQKTIVLCKMFGLARSSDLVKWSFNGLISTPDSIKGPVINAKEQRKGVLSILELSSLDDTNSASKGRRKPHSGDSVFIQNEGKPLDVKEINIIVLSTLSSSGIDIGKFKSHSTRPAMASLLLSNNVPFHVVKKMGRWKSNNTVDTFYDKRIIGEISGGFLNTVVQIS